MASRFVEVGYPCSLPFLEQSRYHLDAPLVPFRGLARQQVGVRSVSADRQLLLVYLGYEIQKEEVKVF